MLSHAVTRSSFRGQYSFTLIPRLVALWTSAQMWSTGKIKKEVHLLWATRTTQTWQRPPALPPALPYAHLRAHLQKSPASCSVFVPGWIRPIGSTPRCVSGCVRPQPPESIQLVFLGGTSDQMSKSPLAVLWFMRRNRTRLCAGWSNCCFGFKHLSLYAIRVGEEGFILVNICNIYIIYVCIYIYMSVLRDCSDSCWVTYPCFPLKQICFHITWLQ